MVKPEQISRILIIQTASLGDVILSTALAETLHLAYPAARIDYLIKKGYEKLFQEHPFVNQVYIWDKSNRKYANLWRLTRQVRRNHYDAVINVQRFATSGFVTVLSGARFRAGFRKNPLSRLFNHRVEHIISSKPTGIHEIDRNHALIVPLTNLNTSRPRIYPALDDKQAIEMYRKAPYITISPASLWFTKQYPAEKWIDFLDQVPVGINIFLLGSNADIELCEHIKTQTKHTGTQVLAGKLSFLQSAALMGKALMNYVNDSAPQHLASAVNAPVTIIFCSTVPEFGFGPLSDDSHIVETSVKLACRPCGLHGYAACPLGHFACAHTIETRQLLETLPLWEEI